ncbi:hypothetical protein POJ06DRAFT_281117 [Lipomyces tetrasporus]|uniref:Transposase putative helix-turn-helix domain-containing protein n=1 Tax=Lipomyces tetrasporus TaxID=54092 RepID=A0AAD7QTR0_9ASCO|nr:uncharacterized protein POJ06DRAFT_281117 [Lipomyces tetrasporus]KAJ8101285.1 hypothetical protein POJ06DRAFT_281117 [Lipomyces tetrasporus]
MAQQKRQQKPPRQQPPLPFWNSGSVQISQRLWLPSSSCHAEKWGSEPVAHGWASCLRWSSTAEVNPTNKAKTEKEPAAKAKRHRLYPTAEEKKILVKWIGAARWKYNECLRAIMDEGHLRREQLGTRTIRRCFRSRTALDKASTGCGAVGSTPFFAT